MLGEEVFLSMNSIFLLGSDDTKLFAFLQRLGYAIVTPSAEGSISEVVAAGTDIILIDGRAVPDTGEVCAFLRSQRETREVPIVCISAPSEEDAPVREYLRSLGGIEEVRAPYSVGSIVGTIATMLRLRKFAGQDEAKATLAEVNLALRDHNERFKRELEEARAIQQGLLPEVLPRDERFDLAVSYQPLEEVGGDWYFASQDKSGALTLCISDVSGHGLSAAFISSMTKLATVASYDDDLATQLSKTTALLGPQLPLAKFVTMAMCRYFPESGKLQWSRAGHPPALLVRRSGESRQLAGEGFPIGFVEHATYEMVEESLEVGDVLLLVTDGVTEVQNRAMQVFGSERLVEVLQSLSPDASAAQILGDVVGAVDTFREGRVLKDDVTLVLLKRRA